MCAWFKVEPRSGAQSHLARKAKSLGLDSSHFKGRSWATSTKGKVVNKRMSIQKYLVIDGPKIRNDRLKMYLIEAGLKKQACEWCGLTQWLGLKIVLELDHN